MPDAIANTTSGSVRGTVIAEGVVFRGIPYAAAPVGARRFARPVAPDPWDGVRPATAFGAICPQMQGAAPDGPLGGLVSSEPTNEDCLFVNVWTPAVDDARRPTMVWVHGGGFTGGSGSSPLYDGAAFARDGVVLVTLNYRLHALGFLYLDELFDGAEATGNVGILDQVAALEWVRDNIAAFGGDPDNVTLFGESAGGNCVGTLLGAKAAKGLFHKAIPQSGAAHDGLTPAAASRVTRHVLGVLGIEPGDWDALRAVPAIQLVHAAAHAVMSAPELVQAESRGPFTPPFVPVFDGTVLDARPIEHVAAGNAAGVSLLVGTCADEWRLFMWGLPPAAAALVPDPDAAPYFARSPVSVDDALAVYGRTAGPGAGRRDVLAAVETDQRFTIPAMRLAEAQLHHADDVWMYRFAWPTPVLDGTLGACHLLDVPFVFDTVAAAASFVGDEEPETLAQVVHGAWVRFATTGDPGGGDLPPWPRYDTARRPVMELNAECRVVDDPDAEVRHLWEGVL